MRARLHVLLALLLTLPMTALPPSAAQADAETAIARGNDAFNRRDYPQAIVYFSDALRQGALSNNRRAYVHLRRGRAHYHIRQYQEALRDHRRATRLNSDSSAAYWALGIDYHALKRYGEAVDAHSRAIHIKPDFHQAFIDRGNSFLNLREYREALRDYETALAIRPNYAIGWNNRGVAYSRLGNKAEAARSYRKAIEIDPDYKLARDNLKKVTQSQ